MKHIIKSAPLQEFIDSVNKNTPINWEDLRSKDPAIIPNCKDHILLYEQDMLSGYTELPLSNNTHIDHFHKRDLFQHLVFDWNNFIVDEKNPNYGADHKDRNTQKNADYKNIINPVTEFPETLMTYDYPNFEIVPCNHITQNDKDRVIFTVKRFNLNHDALNRKRKDLYTQIKAVISQLNDNEIKQALNENGQTTFVDWAIKNLRSSLPFPSPLSP